MTLYEVNKDIAELVTAYDTGAFDKKTFTDTMESMKYDFEEVAEDTIAAYKNVQAEADALRAEEKRLQSRRMRLEKTSDSIKQYLLAGMQQLDLKKVGQLHKASLRKTAGRIEIEDAALLPSLYKVVQEPVPDKKAIKDAINSGEIVPGARLVSGQTVQIA